MSKFDGLYNVRDAVSSDRNFVVKSFLLGLYHGDSWFSMIPRDLFMDEYKKVAYRLFDSPKTAVMVACLPDDPDTILGYSVLSADFQTVHFVYVKDKWRKHGIARKLVPQHPTAVTHLTKTGLQLMPKLNSAVFNPFAIQL